MKHLLTTILFLFLVSCGEPTPKMTKQEIQSLVSSVTNFYGVSTPSVIIDDTSIMFAASLAETECRTDGTNCKIIFRECALSNRSIRELVIHEAAHVVVASKFKIFNHGFEWKNIMKEQGFKRPSPLLHNTVCR